MSIAISDDHRALEETVAGFLERRHVRAAARESLTAPESGLPGFWSELASMGWLGLHVPEEFGGSGFTLAELVIVIEAMGREVTPGPFVPTVVASALINECGDLELKRQFLTALTNGSSAAGFALDADIVVANEAMSGTANVVLSAATASLLVIPIGDDVAIVSTGFGVDVQSRPNLDTARPSYAVSFSNAKVSVLRGARTAFGDIVRLLLSAEAVGVARACTEMAANYARERKQFGRVIGTFQAVKHHCANMVLATELATSAVWDAAKAVSTGGDQSTYTAAVAATLAGPAADLCANLNTQVHGGIAITWEHDAHLYVRRASALQTFLAPDVAASTLSQLTRRGVSRGKKIDLPSDADHIRLTVQSFVDEIKSLSFDQQRERLIETGYVMPHWPKPFGREAGAIEQLVIEQEFDAAGIKRPAYGITAWNILTLIQFGSSDQLARYVGPALRQEVIWCQLFSEPDAGSDAAGVTTRAVRVDGGWLVTGQKVWTSGAHVAGQGFATVRTNTETPKHEGITMMVIDMHAPGVEVRPLKMASGNSEFNEVFFSDVFVPDDDVVGPVDGGWTVARATLGNESVSIGGGGGGGNAISGSMLVSAFDAHPERLFGGEARIGRYIAQFQAMGLLNLRAANRAVTGSGPGPEGAMTKLLLSEIGHEATAILTELAGLDAVYTDEGGALSAGMILMHRAMSIAGGTSEIKRNQIGERILGLPRDPLVK